MELNEARGQIDEIDAELCRLFEERMDLCAQIAEYKRGMSLATLDEARERAKLNSIASLVAAPIKPYAVSLFKEILSLSREYQDELREIRR